MHWSGFLSGGALLLTAIAAILFICNDTVTRFIVAGVSSTAVGALSMLLLSIWGHRSAFSVSAGLTFLVAVLFASIDWAEGSSPLDGCRLGQIWLLYGAALVALVAVLVYLLRNEARK